MKKILFAAIVAATTLGATTMSSCSKEKVISKGDQITLSNKNDKTQTAWADDEKKGVTFTAKSAWTASVAETTRASAVPWLRLLVNGVETYSGSAGTINLVIELSPNYSGSERKATLTIASGGDKFEIVITQNRTTQTGEIPSKLIKKMIEIWDIEPSTYEFTYDSNQRITRISYYPTEGYSQEVNINYSSNRITASMGMGSYSATVVDGRISRCDWVWEDPEYPNESSREMTYQDGYLRKMVLKSTYATYNEDTGKWERQIGTYPADLTWTNGNLTKYASDGTDFTFQYGTSLNKANLDLNWLIGDYLLEADGLGSFLAMQGYLGKRSTNLMVRETYNSSGYTSFYTHTWTFDNEGYPIGIVTKRDGERVDVTYTFEYK